MNNRLCIFFFYDKDGIADRYVEYLINGMKEVSDRIVVVANGLLTDDSRKMFEKYSNDIIVRENEGLDVWAYKTAIDYVGWDELRKYYEVVLMNTTIMGPVYPFSEMFNKMNEQKDLDFWGIFRYYKIDRDPFNSNPYGYIPEHIQSFFTVYRNKFLKSNDLEKYWNNIPIIKNYNESIGKHESYFTKYFGDKGYKWNTYVNNENEKNFTDHYILLAPKRAIEVDKSPVFKRRSFFHNQNDLLTLSMGEQTLELFNYLKENTNYDTDMILENIIRTCHMSDIVGSLNLYKILPSKYTISQEEKSYNNTALVAHIYYMDLLEDSLHYLSSMPETADIYITTPHKDKIEYLEKYFSVLPNKVEIRLIKNRGRDVSALLTSAADLIDKYEYMCFYHDKKVTQIKPYSVGRSFSYKASESALCSREYVQNIITTFEQNPKLGLMTNTPPHHSVYFDTLGIEWGPNYKCTEELTKKIGLKVPISPKKPPIAPLGTVFWFRTKAMKKLFDMNWQYEDFPEEPNKNDGTLLHAIERVYPFVVQDAGYYVSYVMSDKLAAIELSNFTYYIRNLNIEFMNKGLFGSYNIQKYALAHITSKQRIVRNYYKYKILSELTFGKKRRYYKFKALTFHDYVRNIRNLSKNKKG